MANVVIISVTDVNTFASELQVRDPDDHPWTGLTVCLHEVDTKPEIDHDYDRSQLGSNECHVTIPKELALWYRYTSMSHGGLQATCAEYQGFWMPCNV